MTTTPETKIPKGKYPKSVPYIVGNEAAERFSFYGMKAILTVFLLDFFIKHFNLAQDVAEARANEQTHLFITLTYFLPIAGGILADWFMGKYRTILYLSIVYCAGHACLAAFDNNLTGFMFGLMLISIGSGGIKPCVSANVGDQFDKTNQDLLSKVFGWFYFSINFGSFFSTLLTPYLYHKYGPSVAFGVPGILMAIATFIFWLGRKKYIRVPPSGFKKENFLAINFYALFNIGKKQKGQSLLDVATNKYSKESVDGIKSVWNVLAVFAFIPIFWALYDQNGSEWVIQATKMNLNFLGVTWLPAQVQAINPLLILAFIPLFGYVLYPAVEKMGIKVTPLRKIGAGMVLTALTFVIIAWIQTRIDNGESPNIVWQILAYIIITAAEILISITGLEYAYTQAPKSMKSTIMAFWLLTVSLGNYFVSLLNSNISNKGFFAQLEGAKYYWFFFGIMCGFTLLFFLLSSRIKERSYIGYEDNNIDPNLVEN